MHPLFSPLPTQATAPSFASRPWIAVSPSRTLNSFKSLPALAHCMPSAREVQCVFMATDHALCSAAPVEVAGVGLRG
jgi:hypothetical protein